MDALRERTRLYLLSLAVTQGSYDFEGPLGREQDRAEIGAGRRQRLDAVVAMFVELGLVAEREVAPLRGRLDESIREAGRMPVVEQRDVERARELLADRLREVSAAVAAGSDVDAARERFWQCFDAVEICRVLSGDERRQWLHRLRRADPDASERRLQLVRLEACDMTNLRAVVAGGATDDAALRIVTVECYDGATVVHWQSRDGLVAPPAPAKTDGAVRPERLPLMVLTDDVQTAYAPISNPQRGSWAHRWTEGRAVFAGAVPAVARELVAEIRGEALVLALPAGGVPG